MARRATATKEAQPDLLGKVAAPVQENPKTRAKQQVTKAQPAQKTASKAIAVPSKSNPSNTLELIAEALKDPTFKPESMRMVLDMHKEMVAEQARLDFTAAMRAMKRKLPTINKDGRIEYKEDVSRGKKGATLRFASFENIHDVITPLLDEFGFDLWFSAEPGAPGMMNVVGHLEHENGHVRKTILPLPHDSSGGKSGSQGWASAFSFGKRIATIGLLNIQTKAIEDRDLDGNKPKMTKGGKPQVIEGEVIVEKGNITQSDDDGIPKITQKQQDELVEALEAKHVTRKKFCEVYHLDKVADLPAERFTEVMQYVKAFVPKGT